MNLNDENRARLLELGFGIGARASGGVTQGAWFAAGPDGTQVVLKWSPDAAMADRYAKLLPGLDELRSRGVPVPEYLGVLSFDGGTLSAQRLMPGQPKDNPSPSVINEVIEYVAAKAGIRGPDPSVEYPVWGRFVVHALCVGQDGWAMHEPLRDWDQRSARVLETIEEIGAGSDPNHFPDSGLVHLDLHTDNILISDDRITGIIDWEGACAGDHMYDLVQFAFDRDGHNQPIWEVVDVAGFEPKVLYAYLALLALKCTSSAIRHSPADVTRQLDRAERVFRRYDIWA